MFIFERSNFDGYQGNDADERTVCELAERVKDAVVEFQVSSSLPGAIKDASLSQSSLLSRKQFTSRAVD